MAVGILTAVIVAGALLFGAGALLSAYPDLVILSCVVGLLYWVAAAIDGAFREAGQARRENLEREARAKAERERAARERERSEWNAGLAPVRFLIAAHHVAAGRPPDGSQPTSEQYEFEGSMPIRPVGFRRIYWIELAVDRIRNAAWFRCMAIERQIREALTVADAST